MFFALFNRSDLSDRHKDPLFTPTRLGVTASVALNCMRGTMISFSPSPPPSLAAFGELSQTLCRVLFGEQQNDWQSASNFTA
jgi:hypothetical protein